MATVLRVRNWERFQHYHKRNPPWIRLYNELLDNYEFGRLQDASKWHAVGMWLLASRFNNAVPDDPAWIAQRIGARSAVDVDVLITAGFVERCDDASAALAERTQNSIPEGEREGEGEVEREAEKKAAVVLEAAREEPAANSGSTDALALVEAAARRVFSDAEHVRSFVTAARAITTGLDVTVWKNGRGESAPESERSRLIELALNHWEAKEPAERRESSLRSSLRLIVAQQTDAFSLPVAKPSEGSEAARMAPKGVSDDLARQRTKNDRQREADMEVEELTRWAILHPDEAKAAKDAAYANVAKGDVAAGMLALADYRKRIRKLMEAA